MQGAPKFPRVGKPVKRQPGAFPLFCDGRKPSVVTADPWSFLRHLAGTRLPTRQETKALAYLDQARDFFEAAANPRLGSKPLLYYYAFLNLAKFALTVKGVSLPQKIQHGISDPRANSKQQIRFSGQRVQWNGRAHDHSELFPEMLAMLNGQSVPSGFRTLKSLLRQIPTIHRTYCLVTEEPNAFLPLHSVSLLHIGGELWARLSILRSDADSGNSLDRISRRRAFQQLLVRVRSENDSELWFETSPVRGLKRGIDNGIKDLARNLEPLGVSTILTGQGYRLYLTDIVPSQRLPQLASAYAVMFYLGSITRYRPYDFERIVHGGENWIVGEFFSTQPAQFLHTLCSFLAGRAVHKPYAI
jgi:YaaC-like Protein